MILLCVYKQGIATCDKHPVFWKNVFTVKEEKHLKILSNEKQHSQNTQQRALEKGMEHLVMGLVCASCQNNRKYCDKILSI